MRKAEGSADGHPDWERLRVRLAGPDPLGESEFRAMESHLEECPPCRDVFEALLRDDESQRWRTQIGPGHRPRDEGGGAVAVPDDGPEGPRYPFAPPAEEGDLGVLDHYRIVCRLGSGAMGAVFRAYDTRLRCWVAIKLPRPELAGNPSFRKRFEREAQSAAAVRHPHVVTMHHIAGAGPSFPLPYLVMEYVEGESLGERLARRAPLPPREAAEIVRQVASGLSAAHSQGLVHRDIKPSNVMVERGSGRAKLTDFGLARAAEGTELVTRSGALVGTPAYTSPEQALPPHRADARSDVFGVGVLLYELLTGERPFRGVTPAAVLQQIVHEPPRAPRSQNEAVPRDLETITLKCLAKEPARRYQQAADLADDLQRFLAGEPIRARPAGHLESAWLWAKRRPVIAGLVTAVALSLLAGTGVASIFAVRADRQKRRAIRAAADLVEANGRLREALDTTRRYTYVANLNLANRAWDDRQFSRTLELLEAERPRPGESDYRGFEWYFLDRAFRSDLLTYKGHTDSVYCVAFSPDGSRIASAGRDSAVRVWDARTGRDVFILEGNRFAVLGVAYSPDGRWIASAGADGTVRIWDAATGQEARTLSGHTDSVCCLAFSPDGNRIASASGGRDKTVILWDVATGRRDRTFTLNAELDGISDEVHYVAFSPDGTRLAAFATRGTKAWDVASGEIAFAIPGFGGLGAFSPDGKRIVTSEMDGLLLSEGDTGRLIYRFGEGYGTACRLAYSPAGDRIALERIALGRRDGTIWIAGVGKREGFTIWGHTGSIECLAYSPDGRRLASASNDRTVKVWDAVTSRVMPTLEADSSPDWSPCAAFGPGGKQLAFAGPDQTVQVWDAATGRITTTLRGHTGTVVCVAFRPDGKQVASAGADHRIRVWDIGTGREAFILVGKPFSPHGLAYSPDGKQLAAAMVGGEFMIWEADTGRLVASFDTQPEVDIGLMYYPDGKRIASWCLDSTAAAVRVWDPVAGRVLFALQGHGGIVSDAALSPAGDRLASADGDGAIRIWDAATGRLRTTLRGHTNGVSCVAYSPDGGRLASYGGDSIKFWDVHVGREVFTFKLEMSYCQSIAFSSDGMRLVATGGGGFIRIIDATPPRRPG